MPDHPDLILRGVPCQYWRRATELADNYRRFDRANVVAYREDGVTWIINRTKVDAIIVMMQSDA